MKKRETDIISPKVSANTRHCMKNRPAPSGRFNYDTVTYKILPISRSDQAKRFI